MGGNFCTQFCDTLTLAAFLAAGGLDQSGIYVFYVFYFVWIPSHLVIDDDGASIGVHVHIAGRLHLLANGTNIIMVLGLERRGQCA